MAMGTNTWASEIVFLLLITEVIPGSSRKMPVIGLGNILILLLITVSLVLTVISNNYRYVKDCPHWLIMLLQRFISDENTGEKCEATQDAMGKADLGHNTVLKEDRTSTIMDESRALNIDTPPKDTIHEAVNRQGIRNEYEEHNIKNAPEQYEINATEDQDTSQHANQKTVVDIKAMEQNDDLNKDLDYEKDGYKKDSTLPPERFVGHLVDKLCLTVQIILLAVMIGFLIGFYC